MKKLLSVLLVIAMSVGMLAACGTSTPPAASSSIPPAPSSSAPSQETPAANEPVTLKWAMWDLDATAYYKPLVDAYVAKNPHITIEYVDLGSADFMTMLILSFRGADLDVLTIKDIPVMLTQSNRTIQNASSYIASNGIDTSLYGGTVEQITVNNEVYALPFRSDFWLIFYNKDLFDKAGVPYPTNDMTLADYDALARKMTSGSGANKIYGNHYHTWRSAVQLFGILDGKNTIVDGTYDFLKPYYELILKQQDDGICQDYATLKTSSIHYSGVFYNNQIAMMNMGSWFIATQIQKLKRASPLLQTGAFKISSSRWCACRYDSWYNYLISSNANLRIEAALEFMKFVTGPEGAAVIASTGTIPAITNDEVIASISSMDGFPTDDASKEALKTTRHILKCLCMKKSAELRQFK